jgi:hypothetical protein
MIPRTFWSRFWSRTGDLAPPLEPPPSWIRTTWRGLCAWWPLCWRTTLADAIVQTVLTEEKARNRKDHIVKIDDHRQQLTVALDMERTAHAQTIRNSHKQLHDKDELRVQLQKVEALCTDFKAQNERLLRDNQSAITTSEASLANATAHASRLLELTTAMNRAMAERDEARSLLRQFRRTITDVLGDYPTSPPKEPAPCPDDPPGSRPN